MSLPADSGDFKPIADLDPLIHAPARFAILTALYVVQEADFVFLRKQTGLSAGNLSSHLAKLEAAGYVAIEKKFVARIPRTLARLTDHGAAAFRTYRLQLQQALNNLPGLVTVTFRTVVAAGSTPPLLANGNPD